MKISIVVFSPWLMKKEDRGKVNDLCDALQEDFEISVVKYNTEDVTDDKTCNVLKNILSGNPYIFVCVNTKYDFVEHLAKFSSAPIVAVDIKNAVNGAGKAVKKVITAVSDRILCSDSAQ